VVFGNDKTYEVALVFRYYPPKEHEESQDVDIKEVRGFFRGAGKFIEDNFGEEVEYVRVAVKIVD